MPRHSRSPRDLGDPPEDVAHTCRDARPRRVLQRGRNTCRTPEEPSPNRNDSFLLPIRINATAPGLTQCMLGCMYASCSSRSSWKRQVSWSSVFLVRPRALPHPRWRYPWALALILRPWERHCPSMS
uniref:Sad1 and UNC84 domain containing 5 n=1 Tax=Equus asinus TaxID=9793 RepID=A0A9L0JHX6_EQUAS